MRRLLALSLLTLAGSCLTSFPDLEPVRRDGGSDAAVEAQSDGKGGSDVFVESGGECDGGKICGDSCVASSTPEFGCSASNCTPCALDNATAKCEGELCVVDTCTGGYKDCDGLPDNGCEAQICEPIVVAGAQVNPWAVHIDATHVYWTCAAGPNGVLRLLHQDFGKPPEILSTDAAQGDLTLDADYVYWANSTLGVVRRLPKADIKATPQVLGSGVQPVGVAVDDQYVYWTDAGADGAFNGTITRTAKDGDGGSSTVLASGLPSPWLMALDANTVYVTSKEEGSIYAVSKSGGSTRKLAYGHDIGTFNISGWGIAVDSSFVYWREEGYLRKVPVGASIVADAATDQAIDLATGEQTARFVSLLGTDIAWVNYVPTASLGQVKLASITTLPSTQATLVASGKWSLHGIELGPKFIYFTDWGTKNAPTGAVYKIARP